MAAPRDRKHLLVRRTPAVEAYSRPPRVIPSKGPPVPAGGRPAHGAVLKNALEQAAAIVGERRDGVSLEIDGARPGLYVEFESFPGWELAIPSLESTGGKDPHARIEVVAVRQHTVPATEASPTTVIERATVLIPDGKVSTFLRQLEAYVDPSPRRPGERRGYNLFDRVQAVRLATIAALWTDDEAAYPVDETPIWWEVWIRRTDGEALARFTSYAAASQIRLGHRSLVLDDRIIVLAYATRGALAASIDLLDDVAELRKAKELATFFVDQAPADQADWIADLRSRVDPPPPGAAAVTVLDSGVARAHPLLEGALAPQDMHAVDRSWGTHDDAEGAEGHGTQMAGLALYGNLAPLLASREPLTLVHRLESVKILPPPGRKPNPPDLYGAVVATAVSYPEIEAPQRARVFSMAITSSDQRDRGQPTSWSAAIDALCVGRSFDVEPDRIVFTGTGPSRLFVVSAGNVIELGRQHLVRSDLEPVEDPAQAWNVLSVGACTELGVIADPAFASYHPLAPPGDLSPHSTTSVGFATPWPIKPDIVMEGGNIGINAAGHVHDDIPDLDLLTTYHEPQVKPLVTTSGTSAACASAARLCARVMTAYPDLWPETVRGLVVHAARWTPTMKAHLAGTSDSKSDRLRLLRRYGYGVPDEARALRSAKDALTLIAQTTISPFQDGTFRDMHVHDLPWPGEVLASLGPATVDLRVTLSYFIEPNPTRRGWRKRHSYQSHALRFDVRRPLESLAEFRKRINARARDEEEQRTSSPADEGWYFGARAREHGCIHSDHWTGTAAALAERGAIGVYPMAGWWKEQKARDRSGEGVRYALIVSIETPGVETDIWTPVANQIATPIEIEVPSA